MRVRSAQHWRRALLALAVAGALPLTAAACGEDAEQVPPVQEEGEGEEDEGEEGEGSTY